MGCFRVGLVIGALGPGGSERQLTELALGLRERGHVVEVACYDGEGHYDEALREKGVSVRIMHGRGKLEKARLVGEWTKEFRPDVLHGFMKRASSVAILSKLATGRVKVVASDLSTATYTRRSPALWGALALFAFADRVVTQTEANRRSIGLLAPWLRAKTIVVRNGVDIDRFRPPTARAAGPEGFRFLAVGTVYRLKNPVRLVEAVRLLHERRPGFSLTWVGAPGQGGRESPEYREAVRLVESFGLEGVFRFAGLAKRVEDAYRQHDALVHVSVQEGMPNAVIEAMACGLPLVVSRVADLPLVVREARNGFVCDETDPAAIAAEMEKMMGLSPGERQEMGERSRGIAEGWFRRERFVLEVENVYAALLGAAR